MKPSKDVDGFHPVNVGRMALNIPSFLPATPYGILTLLERYKVETQGKHCVVLGRSNIVGSPVSILLSRKGNPGNCTVTMCHSYTPNIAEIASTADILIVAMGKLGFVTADMVKKGAVVVDVGIHRVPSEDTKSGFRLKGDVLFDEVSGKCSYITPVPGGVGPMTRVSLLLNTLRAAKKEITF
jgi:methylenetetrahydrofolate dehydrogenase (NADP+)/methenyltetrahydrofolate cyclohydrolase